MTGRVLVCNAPLRSGDKCQEAPFGPARWGAFLCLIVSCYLSVPLSEKGFPLAIGWQRATTDMERRLRAKLAEVTPGSYEKALTYRFLGDHLQKEGRLKEAHDAYEMAVEICHKLPDNRARVLGATTQILQGRVSRQLGQFARARQNYADLVAWLEPLMKSSLEKPQSKWAGPDLELALTFCHALLEAVDFHRELSQHVEANRYLVKLDSFLEDVVDRRFSLGKPPDFWPIQVAVAYLRAELMRECFHPELARELFEEALSLARKAKAEAKKLRNARIESEISDLELPISFGLALSHYDLAEMKLSSPPENYDRAYQTLQGILERLKSIRPVEREAFEARCRMNLGILLHELANLSEPADQTLLARAEKELQQALAYFSRSKRGELPNFIHTLNSLGLLLLERQKPVEAAELGQEALRALRELDSITANLDLRRNSYMLLARSTWASAGPDTSRRYQAIRYAQEAARCIQRQAVELIGDPFLRGVSRQRLWGKVDATILAWWRELVQQGEDVDVCEILQVFEQTRARSLVEELAAAHRGGLSRGFTAEEELILSEVGQLQIRLAELAFRLKFAEEKEQSAIKLEIKQVEENYLKLLRKLWTFDAGPIWAADADDLSFSTEHLRKLVEWIQARRLLVLYYLTDMGRSFLLTIYPTSHKLRYYLHELKISDDAAEVLRKLLGCSRPEELTAGSLNSEKLRRIFDPARGILRLLASKEHEVPQNLLQVLGSIILPSEVLDRIVDTASYEILVIVADGLLGVFPFQVLSIPYGPVERYLVEIANPIVYTPSLTVCHRLDTRSEVPLRQALTLAKVFFPEYQGRFEPLFHVVRESRQLADLCGSRNIQVLSRVDDSPTSRVATKAELRALAPDSQLLHIATHGLGGEEFGQWGGCLVLSAPAGRPIEEGLLTLPEIYRLPLQSCQLVILSACHTQAGASVEGEGVWGVARGFLVAGARQAVASVWSVEERATSELITRLVRNLQIQAELPSGGDPSIRRGLNTAAALRQAQISLRQDFHEWDHPCFWAPLVLIGAPR